VARRTQILALTAAVVLIAAVVVGVVVAGGDKTTTKTDPAQALAGALSYASPQAQVVAAMDVQPGSSQGAAVRDLARTQPIARFAAEAGRSAVASLGLDPAKDASRVLGGPLVLAGPNAVLSSITGTVSGLNLNVVPLIHAGTTASVVGRSAGDVEDAFDDAVKAGRLRELDDLPGDVKTYALPGNAAVAGVSDADVVYAADRQRLAAAFALHDRNQGYRAATFAANLGPLTQPALIRATVQPRVLIGNAAAKVPFVLALRSGAIALRVAPPGLHLGVHLATDPARLTPEDLPVAPGAVPASPAGGNTRMYAGVRGMNQTIKVLDATRSDLNIAFLKPALDALGQLDKYKGPLKTFGRIDVDAALINQLTGTTTVTQEAKGVGVRAELRDGGPLRTALNRIAAIPDFLLKLATDFNITHSGDEAYEFKSGGTTQLKIAVLGNTLVAATDSTTSLRAIAARRPVPAPRPGALAVHASGTAVQDFLIQQLKLPSLARIFLAGVGNLDGSIQSSLSATDLDAALVLSR
jgi:hypothetical protein